MFRPSIEEMKVEETKIEEQVGDIEDTDRIVEKMGGGAIRSKSFKHRKEAKNREEMEQERAKTCPMIRKGFAKEDASEEENSVVCRMFSLKRGKIQLSISGNGNKENRSSLTNKK